MAQGSIEALKAQAWDLIYTERRLVAQVQDVQSRRREIEQAIAQRLAEERKEQNKKC